MTIRMLRAAGVATAVVCLMAAGAARADECEDMTDVVKQLIDRADPDKAGGGRAKKCAGFAEGLGMLRSFRVVMDECLENGSQRISALAGLDRSIRQLQKHLDKECP